jgi:hypothetical protein
MIAPAPDHVIVSQTLYDLSEQLADVLDYQLAPYHQFPFADYVWVDPQQPERPKHVKHKYVHGDPYRMIVKGPRHLFISHEDYLVWVEVDSTYKQWHVHTNGNPNNLERKLYALFDREDSPWKDIRNPWMLDVQRRTSITRPKWGESTPRSQTHSHPDNLVTPSDSSTPKTLQIVPAFGDLSSLAKPSRRKKG